MNATSADDIEEGPSPHKRVWIEQVRPQVDGGRFDAKADLGEPIVVSCDLVADGHDSLAGVVRFRPSAPRAGATPGARDWESLPLTMRFPGRWDASFQPTAIGRYEFAVDAWVDRPTPALLGQPQRPEPKEISTSAIFGVRVDPALARFAAWYEMFPRSAGAAGQHGTFRDVEARLPAIQAMGFDILYLPPIHPIGVSFRKGKDNSPKAGPDDPGSPWAIGSAEGGHDAVNPALGTLADFRHLVAEARNQALTIAIDIAFQASADHPWIREHPSWFKHRADGSIQYAENPPKKYEDIYPFDFESVDWRDLWNALRDVFLFWIEQGVRVFRVDNPHTKPLAFWQWCLAEVKARCPEAIFLAEAFTRPGIMYALAKLGFSESYTYFTWRQTKEELTDYLRELTSVPVADFFRPNFWPTTPDILPEQLQFGARATFVTRLILAGTLSSNYGIYGPVFELMEHDARPGSEEYARSEKYELRHFDLDDPASLRDLMARFNRIRRQHPALQQQRRLFFHRSDNPRLLAFSKTTVGSNGLSDDRILVVVNLDAHASQAGPIHLDLAALGLKDGQQFLAHDELSDRREIWSGADQSVALDPGVLPAAIFHLRQHVRSERDFDYYA